VTTIQEYLNEYHASGAVKQGDHPRDCQCAACLVELLESLVGSKLHPDEELTDELVSALFNDRDDDNLDELEPAEPASYVEPPRKVETPAMQSVLETALALVESLTPRCVCGRLIHVTTTEGATK
jgi:hypothetical protein